MQGHRAGILDVAASLDDEYVAASSTDQHKINIYRTKTCNKLLSFTGHSDAVNSLKFNYSRKALVSGSSDRTLRTWDIEKNKQANCMASNQIFNMDLSISEAILVTTHNA